MSDARPRTTVRFADEAEIKRAEATAAEGTSVTASEPARGSRRTKAPTAPTRLRSAALDFFWAHRGGVGAAAMLLAACAAASEWQIQTVYSKSWQHSVADFGGALAITLLVACGTALAPSLSPARPWKRWMWLKLGAIWLIAAPLYMYFGLLGPNGLLCVAPMTFAVWCFRKT